MRGDAALIEALERAHIHPLWDRYKRITPVAPRPKDPPMHDTAAVPVGTGTFGSRSIAVGGSALHKAAEKVPEKGRHIAAHLLEAAAGGIEFEAGRFKVAGTDRAVSFDEVARAANVAHRLPLETLEPGLDESAFYDPPNFAFSNGAHICELEVDPETGAVELVSYHAVDDIGTVINPLIVEGRLHGGLAQGIGQALHERTVYEEQCHEVGHARYVSEVEGYDVTYRYHGQLYHTRRDYDPGSKIRVRVNVEPYEDDQD